MRRTLCLLTILAVAAAATTGCSLLKFSLDTGDEPLTAEEVNIRLMTRGFYYDLRNEVVAAADSIAAATPDATLVARAIRWKMETTGAAVGAAMQAIPDVALLDTWLLCRRMDAVFSALPDSLLFGAQTHVARAAAASLSARAGELARSVLSAERYGLMERFVLQYERMHPVGADAVEPTNTTLAWIDFLRSEGIDYKYSTGTISEVVADMSDRVDGQTRHFANSIRWSGELLELRLAQDSLRERVNSRLDSVRRDFARMVSVAEGLPEISDSVLMSLNIHVGQVIAAFDASVDNLFANLDAQRMELQSYATLEGDRLVARSRQAADDVVKGAFDALPALLGRIVGWIVLLFVVVLGAPFLLGFWLGRLRERTRQRRDPDRK